MLVASTSDEEHEQRLRTMLQCFTEDGVLLIPTKCLFGATEVTFLDYIVSAAGTRPLEEKVAAINSFQQPVFLNDLRSFLGKLHFPGGSYHKPPAYKRHSTLILAGPKVEGSRPVYWTTTMFQAFEDCKDSVSRATSLTQPEPSAM